MFERHRTSLEWRQLHWPHPLDPARVQAILRTWAADPRSPELVLEARGSAQGVHYLLGMPAVARESIERQLLASLSDLRLTELPHQRSAITGALRVNLSTRHRPLRSDDPQAVARAVLAALTQVRRRELLVLQIILGPRRIPLAVSTHSPASTVAPWWRVILHGDGGVIDSEKRTALRQKVGDHGFACTIRLGVVANSPGRSRNLLLGLATALRVSQAAGVQLSLGREAVSKLNGPRAPWRWPLRLGVPELLALTAWPVGEDDLPGQPSPHPKRLPPAPGTTGSARVVAVATAPGANATLGLSTADALHHLHVLGPTGTGKSTLLTSLITQDMQAGHTVVVVDPQGDLVHDVLGRVPDDRRDDVIVLDPTDSAAPVGLNPLAGQGRNPEIVADSLLAVFRHLYGDNLGPRSQDILHACLLTLTRRDDASLVMLPLLLTDAGFRHSLTANLRDPVALGPFWAWYEAISEAERQAAIAPLMNKLRQWLIRPSLRAVLGQRRPKLSLGVVFRNRRCLLVSLAQGRLGPEGAALLGSLVVAELWQATQERSVVPATRRHPVMVYLDEFSALLGLPTDLATVLARSRGMGVSYTLAHQFLAQLAPAMRASVLSNTRSRICFQLAHDDAAVIARSHPELAPEDLTSLSRYEVYASLFAQGQVTAFASARTLAVSSTTSDVARLRQRSRQRWGQPLDAIEADFASLLHTGSSPEMGSEPPLGRSPRRPA